MARKSSYKKPREEYWRYPDSGYPRRIWWKVHSPRGYKLDVAQDSDLVFTESEELWFKAL